MPPPFVNPLFSEIGSISQGSLTLGGLSKGGALAPPLKLNYISFSPSVLQRYGICILSHIKSY